MWRARGEAGAGLVPSPTSGAIANGVVMPLREGKRVVGAPRVSGRLEAKAEAARHWRERKAEAAQRDTADFGASVGAVMDQFADAADTLIQSVAQTQAQLRRNAAGTEEAAQSFSAVAVAVEQFSATVGEINRQIATTSAATHARTVRA